MGRPKVTPLSDAELAELRGQWEFAAMEHYPNGYMRRLFATLDARGRALAECHAQLVNRVAGRDAENARLRAELGRKYSNEHFWAFEEKEAARAVVEAAREIDSDGLSMTRKRRLREALAAYDATASKEGR